MFETFVEFENTVPVTIPALLLKDVSPSVNEVAVDVIESALATLVTITFVIFAITSGDGLLGEIQYMIGGFFTFYIIFWLMIAWIF